MAAAGAMHMHVWFGMLRCMVMRVVVRMTVIV
jgi:hypothetical protein